MGVSWDTISKPINKNHQKSHRSSVPRLRELQYWKWLDDRTRPGAQRLWLVRPDEWVEHGWNNKYGIVGICWDLLGRIGVIHYITIAEI